jgi:hypothetical protein
MSAHDMDPSYASQDEPRPRWGFAERADEAAPQFEADESDDFDDPGEIRESVDGLSWFGAAVTAATALVIGIAIGVWVAPVLRPAPKPQVRPIAALSSPTEAPVPLRTTEPAPVAARPPPAHPAPAIRAAAARLGPAPAETAAEQPRDAPPSRKRHHRGHPKAEPAPRTVAAAKPVAPTAKPAAEHLSPIDELLAPTFEAPH